MSRGAPGVRHISSDLRARIESGFQQAYGRRMSDFDFSVMSLSQARQYAGLDEQADDMGELQALTPAVPAQPRMAFAEQAERALAIEVEMVQQATEVEAPVATAVRSRLLTRKMFTIPVAIVLVLGCGGGVMAMSRNDAKDSGSRVVKPAIAPVSEVQGQTSDQSQQPEATPATTPAPVSNPGTSSNGTSPKAAPRSPSAAPRQSMPPASTNTLSPPPALLPDSPTPSQATDPTTTPPVAPPDDTPVTPPTPTTPPPVTPPTSPTPPVDLPPSTSV